MPIVTVILPAYNSGQFLEEAVKSIQAQTTPSYHSAQNCVIFKIESPSLSIFKLFYVKYKGAQAPPACAENMVFIINN